MTELNSRATLDLQDWRRSIAEIKSDIQSLGASKDSSVKINVTDGGTSQRARKQVDELTLATKKLANEAATIRNRFQSGFGQASQEEIAQFRVEMESVRSRALEMAEGLEVGDDRLRKLTQTARTATASIEAAEGNISRLGLASQVSAGVMSTGLINALQAFGPAGQIIANFIEIFFSNAESSVQDGGKKTAQAAKKTGEQTAEGFADGLQDNQQVKRAATEMAASATDSIKAELDINSPSRVAYTLGQWTAEGFEQGIRAGQGRVAQAARELAKQVPQNLNSNVSFGAVDVGLKAAVPSVQALSGEFSNLKNNALAASGAINTVPDNLKTIGDSVGSFFEGIGQQTGSIEILGNTSAAAASAAADQVTAVGQSIDAAEDVLNRVTGASTRWGQALTAVGLVLAGLTANGIRQLGAFEKAFNTFGASGERDFAALQDSIDGLQQSGGRAAKAFGRTQLAGALADTIKAGTTSSEALTVLGVSTKLAASETTDLTVSSGRLLKNLRQFGVGVDQAARFGDALAKAGGEAAGDVASLSEGLATVGVVAKAAGFDLEDTLGVLVELDKKGLDAAQEGATGLRTVLSALADPSDEAATALESLNINLTDINGKARPTKAILFELVDALRGNAEAGNIASKIFGTEGVAAFLSISDASKKLATEFRDSKGALDDYSNAMTEGSVAATTRLKSSIDDLSITMVKSFGPGTAAVLETITALTRGLIEMKENGTLLVLALAGVAAGAYKIPPAIQAIDVSLTRANWARWSASARAGIVTVRTAAAGLFTTLRTFIATNPFTVLLAGASTLAIYLNDIFKDLQAAQEQLSRNELSSTNTLLNKVNQLRAANTELGRLQAKQLLLIDQLNSQVPDGTDFLGNVKYKPAVDGPARDKLLKDLKDLNAQIQAEQKRTQSSIKATTDQTIKFSADALDAISKIGDLKLDLMSPLDREIAQIKGKVEDLISELKATIKNKGALEIKIKEVREIEQDLLARARADAAKDAADKAKQEREAKKREKEQELQDLRSANKTAADLNRAARDAEIANIQDAGERLRREREAELADLRSSIAEQVRTVSDYPEQRQRAEAAGQRQIQALRQRWAEEDEKAEREQSQKRLGIIRREQEQVRSLLDARATAIQQGIEAQLANLSNAYERERLQAGDNAEQILQVEKRFAAERTRLQLALLRSQQQDRLRQLKEEQNDALAQEGLTATERVNIVRRYMQETLNVEAGFRSQRQKVVSDGALAILKAEQDSEAARTRALEEQKKERERLAEEEARNRAEAARAATDAERAARDANVDTVEDPVEQTRQRRQNELQDLQDSINKQIEAVKQYPVEVARIRSAGQRQIQALQKKWQQEDLKAEQDANQKRIDEARRAEEERQRALTEANDAVTDARDGALAARIAAITDEPEKLRAQREKELQDLRASIAARVEAAKGYPDKIREIQTLGQQEIQALQKRWDNEDLDRLKQANREKEDEQRRNLEEQQKLLQSARDAVQAGQDSALNAEIAAITDDVARKQAERDRDLRNLQKSIADRVQAVRAYPELVREVEEAGQREISALRKKWAAEDLDLLQTTTRKKQEELQKLAEDVDGGNAERTRTVQRQLIEQRLDALQDYYDFQSELTAGNVEEQIRLERQGLQQINNVRLEGLRVAREQELQSLQESLRKQLDNELLSEQQRLSIRQSYAALIAQVEEKYALERLSIERNLITGLSKLDRSRRDALQSQLDKTRDLLDVTRELQDTLNGGQQQPVSRQDIQDLAAARDQAVRAARAAIQSGDATQQVRAFQNLNAVLKNTADLQERISKPSQDLRELQARRAELLRDLADAQKTGDRTGLQKLAGEYLQVQQQIQQTTTLLGQQREAEQALQGLGIIGRDLRLQDNQIEAIRQSLTGLTRDATQTSQTLATQLEAEVGKTLPDTFGKLGLSAGEQFTRQFVEYLNSNLNAPLLGLQPQPVTPRGQAPDVKTTQAAMNVTNNFSIGDLVFPEARITNPTEFARMLLPELQKVAQQEQNLKGAK